MIILKAIGAFFVKIWRWIKDTAWVQPLLIVGAIFAALGVFLIIKGYQSRVGNPAQEIDGRPNYNYGPVKFASIAAMFWGVAGFLVYAFAAKGWMFLAGLPVSALWAISAPATQALITRQVGPRVQGRIQGALTGLVSMAGMVGPALFAGSFGYFISDSAPAHIPGVPFLIAGGLLGASVLVAWRYARIAPAPEPAIDPA